MNVVRIDTAAMSSGTRARKEAKTNSKTASAPSAPEQRLGEDAGALRVGALPGRQQLVAGQLPVEASLTSSPCRGSAG